MVNLRWMTIWGLLIVVCGCASTSEVRWNGPPPSVAPSGRWDNRDWRRVLWAVVSEDGRVRYDLLVRNVDGVRDALGRYVEQIARSAPWNRPDLFPNETDRLACYLNAYNALAMEGVLEKGLPKNVALGGLFKKLFRMGAHEITLDELMDQYLRTSGDPRVHFAACTMSRSGPPLRNEPYSGAKIDEQLADQTRRYLSDPRYVKKVDSQTVALCELLTRFYPQDFKDAYARASGRPGSSLIEALAVLAPPESPLREAKFYRTIPYDWSINSAE